MKRICLVRLSAMGDVVQSLGAVQALARARPDLELHFVTQTENLPLLEGLGLRSVIAHDRGAGVRGLLQTRKAMRALQPDCAIDLQGNWKSAVVTRMSGAGLRMGALGSHRQEPASALLFEHGVEIAGPKHPARIAHRLLQELEPRLQLTPARLTASADELDRAIEAVRAAGLDPVQPFTLLVVTHPGDVRSWPVAAMARQAELETDQVLWLRGPAEAEVELPAAAASITQGRGQVRELVALGCLVHRRGGRVLGPDQGATHVLAACGAPTLVFYGPQDPERTAPLTAQVLQRRDGPPCVPCRSGRCLHEAGPVCMDFTSAGAG